MEIRPQNPTGRLIIQRYGDGRFVIGDQVHAGSVLLLPDRAVAWPVRHLAELAPEHVADVAGIELLLLGCGADMGLPPATVRADLRARGIVLEAMATGAACRTYNVLVLESRRVGAALIAV